MDLILLLGAHRTGSTALERVLARNAGALEEAGLGFWPQARLRRDPAFGRVAALTRHAPRRAEARAALDGLRGRLADQWQAAVTGMRGLLLSEENMLGHMATNLRGPVFYPEAAERLRAYAAVLPAPPRRIGLGLRAYAAYWVSAYRYILPRHALPGFAALRGPLAAQERGWCDLVADVASVFPAAELLVWPQEALDGALPSVAAQVIGYPPGAPALTAPARRINAAPPAEEAALIQALRHDRPRLKGAELRAALELARRDGVPAADVEDQDFTPAQRRDLDRRYAQDLAALAGGHAGARLIAWPAREMAAADAGAGQQAPEGRGAGRPVDERT